MTRSPTMIEPLPVLENACPSAERIRVAIGTIKPNDGTSHLVVLVSGSSSSSSSSSGASSSVSSSGSSLSTSVSSTDSSFTSSASQTGSSSSTSTPSTGSFGTSTSASSSGETSTMSSSATTSSTIYSSTVSSSTMFASTTIVSPTTTYSTTASSTSSSATPSSTTLPSCPGFNGQTFMLGGVTFKVYCDSDTPTVPTLYNRAANSISDCAAICAQDSMCGAATYTSRCYIKGKLGTVEPSTVGTIVLEVIQVSSSSSSSSSMSTAFTTTYTGPSTGPSSTTTSSSRTSTTDTSVSSTATTPSSTPSAMPACPDWNNKEYTANGVTFEILCNTDNDVNSYTNVAANNIADCAAACSDDTRCLVASFTSRCYLKSSCDPIFTHWILDQPNFNFRAQFHINE
ncbi:wsc-domain-containing protein [Diplodia corticola]|uniref:Wsc-domain-containing protein n=1 Tax=Diplodia corticola TaxID=236234 RepID=A0A1J9S801_9PEZI|nr:wsc-domain-containing protein [Diplodia corticola]OJD35709.1 wsc-domain-containing protein [Diplodia corticola]